MKVLVLTTLFALSFASITENKIQIKDDDKCYQLLDQAITQAE